MFIFFLYIDILIQICVHGERNIIYIYIYIYIYSHPQTDCFVLSELFSVARHAGSSKPGSKPVQLYVRLCFRYVYICVCVCVCVLVVQSSGDITLKLYWCVHIYIYTYIHTHIYIHQFIYIYVRVAFNKVPDFFCTGI